MTTDLPGYIDTKVSNLHGEMKAQETRLVRWIVGMGLGVSGIFVIAIGIFERCSVTKRKLLFFRMNQIVSSYLEANSQ